MNIAALQTVRMGSKSVPNKNLTLIDDSPLWSYNAMYARECKLITDLYISTDILSIHKSGYKTIKRPENLCGDDASHYDVILHGLQNIDQRMHCEVEILVILLGNNNGAYEPDLTCAIKSLINNPKADSIMSVGKYNMFNPYRAYKYSKGYADTYVDQKTTKKATKANHNDKNAYGDAYFFNGSFWICRREAIIKNNGLLPFPWLGKKILMYEQEPDIMEIDAFWQIKLLD
jgi:CMP-N-acetylneuraminic acid synthetase